MKKLLALLAVGLLSTGLALVAQNGTPQGLPPGRENCPNAAACDKNGDGICDITGQPIGECRRGTGQGRGRGPGNGTCQGSCPRDGSGAGPGPQQRAGRK